MLCCPAQRPQRPEKAVLTAALDGDLTPQKLDKLLPAAATAAMIITYRGELARQAEHTILGQSHRELQAGGCDAILDSLRPQFERHAETIATARCSSDQIRGTGLHRSSAPR